MEKCRLCGKRINEIGGYFKRVNKVGELPAVWECAPSCDAQLTPNQRVLAAIDNVKELYDDLQESSV